MQPHQGSQLVGCITMSHPYHRNVAYPNSWCINHSQALCTHGRTRIAGCEPSPPKCMAPLVASNDPIDLSHVQAVSLFSHLLRFLVRV